MGETDESKERRVDEGSTDEMEGWNWDRWLVAVGGRDDNVVEDGVSKEL